MTQMPTTPTTPTTPSRRCRPARWSRCLASAIVAASLGCGVSLATTSTASASNTAVRASSDDLASAAGTALDSLETWTRTGLVPDYVAYTAARSRLANAVAFRVGVKASELLQAWSAVGVHKQHAMMAAMSQIGVPYRTNASSEGEGFDCSGLMLFAFERAGLTLPRTSRDQFRASEEVEPLQAEPGDLVYYPGHISLYIGLGLMVHSPQSGQDVEVRSLFDRSLQFGDLVSTEIVVDEPPIDAAGPVFSTLYGFS